jgi:transcriptional regulator with XRE-family HTH domain
MGRKYAPAGYRELGAEMRKLRHAAGMTGRQIGMKTGWDPTKVSKIEAGLLHIDVADLTWYLGVLRVPHDQAVPLITLCRQARDNRGYWMDAYGERIPDMFSSLLYHEATANASTSYEPLFIPGLLQTERYARTVISRNVTYDSAEIGSSVRIRMDRRRVLNFRDRHFTFYVHEQALHTVVGDGNTMSEQLVALALAGSAPNVTVRVISGSIGESPALAGSFRIFEFEDYEPLVHLDSAVAPSFWFEDREYVAPYRALALNLAGIAVSVEESRSFIAALADEYDRGSILHADDRVAEEQL